MAMEALSNQSNRSVHIKREQLVEVLKMNREKHVAEFEAAMKGYKDVARKKIAEAFEGLATKLDKRRAELYEHIDSFSPDKAKDFRDYFVILQQIAVPLTVPVSYADAYDQAIDMATFDTRDVLELSGAEFQCFVRDVWDWTETFRATSAVYVQ